MIIYLTGFMGAGKSTIGKALAKKLDLLFIDLDAYIEEKTFLSVSSIFKQFGEAYFRTIEWEYLQEISLNDNCIVALGGGTLANQDALKLINMTGKLVYLRATESEIFDRLSTPQELAKRPLIAALSPTERKKYIKNLLALRTPIYNTAHYTVDSNDKAVANLVKYCESKLVY